MRALLPGTGRRIDMADERITQRGTPREDPFQTRLICTRHPIATGTPKTGCQYAPRGSVCFINIHERVRRELETLA